MVSEFQSKRLNQELKKITEDFKRNYEIVRKSSEDKYKASLPAGAVVGIKQGFYFEEDRKTFDRVCNEARQKAHALVDPIAKDILDLNTKAPTTEAVNVVTLINAREHVSADEIDQLMTKYGRECPMVYRALYDKAQSLGYKDFMQHPISEEAENIESLSSLIDRTYSTAAAEHNILANTAAMNVTIDSTFPIGE